MNPGALSQRGTRPLAPHTASLSAAARSGVCSSSPRCSSAAPLLDGHNRRPSAIFTIAPDRSGSSAFWAPQIKSSEGWADLSRIERTEGELEALRRSLDLRVNGDTSIRRPDSANVPTLNADNFMPSLGWRWRAHQLRPEQLWEKMREEAISTVRAEPYLAGMFHSSILQHPNLASAAANILAGKLSSSTLLPSALSQLFLEAYSREPGLVEAFAADLNAVYDRDPACSRYVQGMMQYKGVQAIQAHRVAHWLWIHGRKVLAQAIQSRVSEACHVDIHPGAQLGWGVMMDHATGIVIGETTIVGDNVSMLHHVTLGGSGTGRGIRHPTVGHGVLLGAGVSVLGPIMIGAGAKVGAGSVVVRDLPSHCVAVGVPARIVKHDIRTEPVQDMDQCCDFIMDYVI